MCALDNQTIVILGGQQVIESKDCPRSLLDNSYSTDCYVLDFGSAGSVQETLSLTRVFPRNVSEGFICERNECAMTNHGETLVASVADDNGDRSLLKYSAKTNSISILKSIDD